MSFISVFDEKRLQESVFIQKCCNANVDDVKSVLNKKKLAESDLAILLSPVARDYMLEDMAKKAYVATKERFGKTVKLYVPLYLSNYCTNCCVYCSFASSNKLSRKFLCEKEVIDEVMVLKEKGFKSILLVAGEDPENITIKYLSSVVAKVKKIVPSVSVEVAPYDISGYKKLVESGLDGVTIYQETYDSITYKEIHRGSKADFYKRLEFPENAAKGGVRRVGIGSLLGLSDYRVEAYYLFNHLKYLYKNFWQVSFALSFPRIRPVVSGFTPKNVISDRELVQMILAFRLCFDELDLVLSTRESSNFRDSMLGLGVTVMSAGSRTDVGGYYLEQKEGATQFEISDKRSVNEVFAAIKSKGYEPIWKDWEEVMYGIE